MKLCIFGSCVSRDIFNHAKEEEFELLLYSARSSLGSLFSKPPFKDTYSANLQSPFQQRTLAMDLCKTAIRRFNNVEPDIIMLDLIDERFNLLVMPDQTRCTASREMIVSGAAKHPGGVTVRSGTDRYMKYWADGWRKLVALLQSRNMMDRLLINKVYWQYTTESGKPFNADRVARANETLEKMYAIQEADVPPRQFIDYGDSLSCPDDHRWTPEPFHFSNASHLVALDKVRAMSQQGAAHH